MNPVDAAIANKIGSLELTVMRLTHALNTMNQQAALQGAQLEQANKTIADAEEHMKLLQGERETAREQIGHLSAENARLSQEHQAAMVKLNQAPELPFDDKVGEGFEANGAGMH